jgi:hypothetical protein
MKVCLAGVVWLSPNVEFSENFTGYIFYVQIYRCIIHAFGIWILLFLSFVYYCFCSFFLNLLLLTLSWSLISGSNQASFGSPALQFPPSFFSHFCVSRLVSDSSATLHTQALYQPTGTISPSIVPCRLMHGSSLAFSSQEDLNMKINFLQHPSIFLAICGKHV